MNIGEKIKRLRTEKLMTQAELAGDRITRNMLSLIEKGTASPSVQTLVYLAERLNVSTGYLLADKEEEGFFLKSETMSEIRLAYGQKQYAICLDLCQRLRRSVGKDDELLLIMAECALALGKEQLFSDRVRPACARFDEAVKYAFDSVYHTEFIEATVVSYFKYLESISPSVGSEVLDIYTYDPQFTASFSFGDDFCRYLTALDLVERGAPLEDYLAFAEEKTPILAKHISAKSHMRAGDFERAGNELGELLKYDDRVAGVVLYHVFEDLETCCRKLNKPKHAKVYAESRVAQFERLMF